MLQANFPRKAAGEWQFKNLIVVIKKSFVNKKLDKT